MRKIGLLVLVCILLLAPCATKAVEREIKGTISVTGADSPQAQFATQEIYSNALKAGFERRDSGATWNVVFKGIDSELGEQSYRIMVEGNTVSIEGGDTTGLMYGGLEVAEQIRLYGIEGVKATTGSPYILVRGTKVNIPLDLRTPSYSDGGLSGQSNMDDMWDLDFWHEYIDQLARYRINAISLWSLDPFPSMVKVPEYPDIALDDVWRTKEEIGTVIGNRTNITRPEHYKNIEVVKKITIDEKIEFWKEVMQYAADRGIDFYIYTWNIYTFTEEGKYGITSLMGNETTMDYYRCSVRELVDTYPLLKGIGITAGENMSFSGEAMGASLGGSEIEQWLYNTYGKGINDALSDDPDRDFQLLHRMHYADFANIAEIWSGFKGDFHFSEKYSIGRMISGTKPTFSLGTFESMPKETKCYLELRQDDMFHLKFGDSSFMREYLLGMPPIDRLSGCFLGTDDYVHCVDSANVDDELNQNLYIDNHWIFFTLYGRLAYNPHLPDTYIADILSDHFGGSDGALLLQTMVDAYEGKRLWDQLIWFSGAQMYTEGGVENGGTYYHIGLVLKNRVSLPDSGIMSINATALAYANGTDTSEYDMTAFDVIDQMLSLGQKTLDGVSHLQAQKKAKGISKYTEKEWDSLLVDQEALGYLTLYYGEKLNGAMQLRLYNDSSDASYQNKAVEALTRALEYWKKYAELFSINYQKEELMCQGWVRSIDAVEEFVAKDIEIAKTWKIRKIQ